MDITSKQLKQLIKEELQAVMEAEADQASGPSAEDKETMNYIDWREQAAKLVSKKNPTHTAGWAPNTPLGKKMKALYNRIRKKYIGRLRSKFPEDPKKAMNRATIMANEAIAKGKIARDGNWQGNGSTMPPVPEYMKASRARKAAKSETPAPAPAPPRPTPAPTPAPSPTTPTPTPTPSPEPGPEPEEKKATTIGTIEKGMRRREVVRILADAGLTWKDLRKIKKDDPKYALRQQYGAWYRDLMGRKSKTKGGQAYAARQKKYAAQKAARRKARIEKRNAAKKKKAGQAG